MTLNLKVFDWMKAARLIRSARPRVACAGLSEDWDMTSTTIYEDSGIVMENDGHLASTWATPSLVLIDDHGQQEWIDCYVMSDDTSWNESTRWPLEAVAELHAAEGVA